MHIVGVFIGLDGDKNVELVGDEPYCLSIFIVYSTESDPIVARKECDSLAISIKELIIKAYGKPEEATEISLESCAAIADSRISLADLMKVDQWRLEWLSLSEGEEEFLNIGKP